VREDLPLPGVLRLFAFRGRRIVCAVDVTVGLALAGLAGLAVGGVGGWAVMSRRRAPAVAPRTPAAG
jgi:hypothetical protein